MSLEKETPTSAVAEKNENVEMSYQEYVDYVNLQEWKVREIKAALDMYRYDQELKALQESLTIKNKTNNE